jgi:hypothetical protein
MENVGTSNDSRGTKTCPQCSEEVKAAAKICRYCRYEFPQTDVNRRESLNRIPCSDGSCTGIINENGVCGVCGRGTLTEEEERNRFYVEKKERIKVRRKIRRNWVIGGLVITLLLIGGIMVGIIHIKKSSDSPKPHWEGGQIIRPDADQINKANENYRKRQGTSTSSSSEWLPLCMHVWQGIEVYYGPDKTYWGRVVDFDDDFVVPSTGQRIRAVKVQMSNGSVEWKDRDSVICSRYVQLFVKRNDPALR